MMDVILTGPKHCGKTAVGKVLAQFLSKKQPFPCEFFDLDELIIERTGKTPRELYIEGQKVFQNEEAGALKALLAAGGESGDGPSARRVIAAGGGIIDNRDAMADLSKSDALKVYLDISAETAWRRIARKSELPPFLRTENPQETHRVLHERRAVEYQKLADIIIKTEGKTIEKVAEEILEKTAG
jgi:shikimate kinase